MTEDVRTYEFGEGFQRKILALAIRSDLLMKAPGAFQSQFFGVGAKVRSPSPRFRLARLVENFSEEHRQQRPGNETMDELVKREAKQLKPAERDALEQEWKEIRSLEVPDVDYVVGQVRYWAKDAAISRAVMAAADIVERARQTGRQEDFQSIRRMMDEAVRVGEPEALGSASFITDDHHHLWAEDHSRRKVKTSFKRLDTCLDGGPQFGECFYILAPPKGGKSAFLLNLALNVSRLRHGVAFFSYEMRTNPLIMRMDRNIAKATKYQLREDPEKVRKAVAGLRAAGAGDVWIQEFNAKKQGAEEGARIVERRRGMGHEVSVIVYDYLNIMSPARQERELRHQLPAISREMSAIAKELDVVVWSAALVNRKSVEKERIKKTDIAEAFEVVAVADGMIAICAPVELRQHGQRRLYLAALREEEDERDGGIYQLDLDRMTFKEAKYVPEKSGSKGTEKDEADT